MCRPALGRVTARRDTEVDAAVLAPTAMSTCPAPESQSEGYPGGRGDGNDQKDRDHASGAPMSGCRGHAVQLQKPGAEEGCGKGT